MKKNIERIIKSYMSNYVEPLQQQMYPDGNIPYYPEQEQTYTDLSHLDSVHGEGTFKERNKFVYDSPHQNVDWAGGNFTSPTELDFHNYEKYSPNTNESLSLKGASMINLNPNTKNLDNFLSPPSETKKISNMDLSDFLKLSDDTLVHKSRNDLWKIVKTSEGEIHIQRLFNEPVIKDY